MVELTQKFSEMMEGQVRLNIKMEEKMRFNIMMEEQVILMMDHR